MKKIIALLMFAVLSVSVFALTACGKDPGATVTPPQSLIQRSSKNTNSSTIEDVSTTPSTSSEDSKVENSSNSTQEPTSSVEDSSSSVQESTSSVEDSSSSTQEPTSSQDPTPETPTPTPSGEILSTTETSVKNSLYISSLRVGSAGLYYLGSNSGSNYIFKVEVTQGSTTYVLNASDMTAFAKDPGKADGERIPCGTNNYFTLLCAATKTAIDASAKTFSDTFSGTQRINFGGKTQTISGVMTNAIEFTTTDAADVKVWWVSGGDGRQVDILKGESAPVNPEPTVPAEVTALIEQIDLIGTINVDNYVAKETEVAAAESAYTALSLDNQALVTNYAKLTSARTAINEFKAAAEAEAAAQEKVEAFKTAVGAIGEVSFTPECKALLDAADAAYALVPTTHQSQVATEKAELEAKKQAYLDAELATLPEEVQAVMTSINAIGEVTANNYLAKDTEIASIEEAYGLLSTDNQALVSNYSKLTSAKATVEEFKAAEAAAQEKIAAFRDAVSAIGTVEYTPACKSAIDAADTAYNAIPATHVSQVATEKSALDNAKAQYDELVALSYVIAFENAVNAIATPITTSSKAAIDAAYTAYNAIPATHTANAADAKATLDGYKADYEAAVQLAADQAAVDAFMTKYNAVASLTMSDANFTQFQTVIDAFDTLTASQIALLDSGVATNVATWKANIGNFKPKEPITTTFSFENTSTGWTSNQTMKFVSGASGQGWQTSSSIKGTVIYETDETYYSVTSVSLYVMSSGGGGVTYKLYIGDSQVATITLSSTTNFSKKTALTYNGAAVSGKIKIEAISTSNRGSGIDEVVIKHTPL